MKKRISLILCSLVAVTAMNIHVLAAGETIIGANQMTWTNDSATVKPIDLNAEWGDGTNTPQNIAYNKNVEQKAAYDSLPSGTYRVSYYLTKNHLTDGTDTGRSARILDTDVHITDKNGSYDIISVKDFIYDEGYKDLGVYEFDDTHKSISVTVNNDNNVVKGQWDAMFAVSHIKLEPVTEEHSDLLNAVNTATGADAIRDAVENVTINDGFVDSDALFKMDDAYTEMYNSRPEGGWTSSYHFKRVFEQCVENQLTAVTIPSSSFVWQSSEANTVSKGWRINWNPIELSHKQNSNVAVATFKFTNTEHIKRLNLKLNYDTASNTVQNSVVITRYSGDVYENASANKVEDKGMNSVVFKNLTTEKKQMLSAKDIADSEILDAIAENGYLSLYMRGDSLTYGDGNCGALKLSTDAQITAYYDLTYLGGEADLAYFAADDTAVDADSVAITNTSIKIKQADGKKFESFDFLDYITVQADGTDMATTDYTVAKVDDTTISLTLTDGFKYDTEYTVKSDKFINFEGDSLSYEFAAKFNTEKYPVEFSGITLKDGGTTVTSPDGMNGKTLTVEGTIKNNAVDEFDAYLVVNLYEQTENGAKMIKSLLQNGKIARNGSLSLNDTFNVPSENADYFITAYIWDGIKTMNFVKMYNTDSYQRID